MSCIWACDITLIEPELAGDISRLLGLSEWDWEVYRGWASPKAQAELYKRYLGGGPLAAKPGHSAHETLDIRGEPAALAVDILRLEHGKELWDYGDSDAWPWLWAACIDHPRLHSGHTFGKETGGRVPADNDHIQSEYKWILYKARLIAAGKW